MDNVENLWKSLLKSLRKICGQKSGKNLFTQKVVDKSSFSQSFATSFHVVLNKSFSPVKYGVFHVFHIAYYYNY